MLNKISMLVGSQRLSGWKTMTISKSLDALADQFHFAMVDVWDGGNCPLVPYEKCQIFIEKSLRGKKIDELVLTGYIDSINVDSDSNAISLSTTGRSKTGDIVDCSAEFLPSNSWNNTQLSIIIRDLLLNYDVALDFISSSASDKDSKLSLSINSGESIFEIIDRECKKREIIPVTNPYGNIELITVGDRVSQDKLIFGQNILSASVSYDYANRFSKYKVKSQKNGDGSSWKGSTTSIFAEANDPVFKSRYRYKSIVLDGAGTNKDAQNSAAWEAQIRAGKTGRLTIKIPTWFQSDNSLWEIGTLVYCEILPFRIEDQLLLNNVQFLQDDGGTISQLEFVHKDTYLEDPSLTVAIASKSKKTGVGYGW